MNEIKRIKPVIQIIDVPEEPISEGDILIALINKYNPEILNTNDTDMNEKTKE